MPTSGRTHAPRTLIAAAIGLLLSAGAASAQTASFASWRDYLLTGADGVADASGSGPYAVTTGDFDGDAAVDIAVTNIHGKDVRVLLNDGDGTFLPPKAAAVGENPVSIATADFNGDSNADLAVALLSTNRIVTLLGNGDGTFGPPASRVTGVSPIAVAAGDLDADGAPDLVVAHHGSHSVAVLLGNGDGTFMASVHYAVGNSPTAAVIGDFTGDGALDAATANSGSGTVSVLPGSGDGTFGPAVHTRALASVFLMAAGDFDRDSRLDLVVTTYRREFAAVLPGSGDGRFASPKVFFNTYPDVIAADFNADSRLDVALTAIDGIEGMVLLRFGRGDGTFDAPTALGAGRCNVRAAAADVNGDAATDLVTANYCGDSVSVLLNAGGGVFEQPATWTQAAGLCVHGGDFNGDGRLDLALCGNGAAVVLGNGDGTYQPPNVVAAGFETISMTLGDFNGDGSLDIAAGRANEDPVNEQVVLLPGNGDGTFQAPIYVPVAGRPGTFYVASGDFDGDLNADLITGDRTFGTITVLSGNGDGSFRTASILETGHFVTQLVVSDFNGDAKPDFLIAGGQLFFGNGDGTFGPLIDIRPDTYPAAEAAVAGDFNGDAKQDLALVFGSRVMGDGRSRPGLGVLLGNGDGTFEHADAQAYPLGRLPYSIAAADYDGDGVLDVATGNYGSNDVSVFSGNGDGTFEPALHFGATGGPNALVAGDVTGDGKPDLVAPVRTNFPAAPITQLINNTQ